MTGEGQMKDRGKLIVIEGLDGSGKATQAAKLRQYLEARGDSALQVEFPDYGSESSALVRMYLAGEIGGLDQVNAYAASAFYAADRYISYQNKWKKPFLAGYTIVSDRYTTSNAVHQMSKLPKEQWDDYLRWLEDCEYVRMELPRPDLVVYLDMHPDTSRVLLLRRSAENGMDMDLHERDLAYLLRCRDAALYAAGRLGWHVVRCCDSSSPYPVEEVFDKIQTVLEDL